MKAKTRRDGTAALDRVEAELRERRETIESAKQTSKAHAAALRGGIQEILPENATRDDCLDAIAAVSLIAHGYDPKQVQERYPRLRIKP